MGKKRRGKIAGTPRHSERMHNDICSFDRSPGKFWLLRKRSSLRNPVTNLVDECEVNFLAAKSIQCGSSYIYIRIRSTYKLSSRFLFHFSKQDLNVIFQSRDCRVRLAITFQTSQLSDEANDRESSVFAASRNRETNTCGACSLLAGEGTRFTHSILISVLFLESGIVSGTMAAAVSFRWPRNVNEG